jgi:hypothetical protein
MKAGVRIVPRCIVIAPVRAAPSIAAIEKENLVIAALPSGSQGAPLQGAR